MIKLENLNEEILEKVKFIDKDLVLSNPLLISSNVKGKILYLGQETNTWCGSHKDFDSAKELEKLYDDFFLKNRMPNTLYWKYIREATNCCDVANDGNITWNNIFICSNVDRKGTPVLFNEINDLSVYYLANIIDILKIEKIISAVGPKNPYYDTLNMLANELGWSINDYPTVNKPCVYSDNEKILYTYHPMYLQKSKNLDKVIEKTKKFINK